jgi:hypothetical protein
MFYPTLAAARFARDLRNLQDSARYYVALLPDNRIALRCTYRWQRQPLEID